MQLVHFTSVTSEDCNAMRPEIEDFINENQDLDYIQIDVEKDFDLLNRYTETQSVDTVPTFFAVDNGAVLKSHVGFTNKNGLAVLFT